ncbi:hypothetical protein OEZ85_008643 [Tetradesmus obliquus]|uniref:BTB domain-containing protein n=1 Tax=Tetradesmus obliquus TaxID=3088 RepID=A0ABY8TJN1_TETOB|nr:hypothetical protein OEZ85_008643 [Tetradesmus obliquus]
MASAAEASPARGQQGNTTSKTITDTIVGEHTHTIVGYSLIKGIGDGEPIASERFSVGGHEWVLLFYPDGKRSSSSDPQLGPGDAVAMHHAAAAVPPPGMIMGAAAGGPPVPALPHGAGAGDAGAAGGGAAAAAGGGDGDGAGAAPAAAGGAAAGAPGAMMPGQHHGHPGLPAAAAALQLARMAPPGRRDTTNEYAALFVALIGEGPNPQGVVNTNEGKVVRAFHRFTLVDQTGQGRDLTKGRTREAGAVKISCARQDPNARNCHGYRKFVKRNILEDPARGFLANDTIIIKYTIELVVSSGGALSRSSNGPSKAELIKVPPPSIGKDLGELFYSGQNSDYVIVVDQDGEQEEIKVHRMLLESRSPFFRGMLESNMAEAQQGRYVVRDMLAPVVKAVLHFIYTDQLPEEHEGTNLEVAMAQHLLAAADMYQLTRLRRICERRLCESVDVETAATTLALAEQNHAEELKRVCLDFVSRHLAAVMQTDGYRHMTRSCPSLQAELLQVIASTGAAAAAAAAGHERAHGVHRGHPQHVRRLEEGSDERRVRQRRGE